MIHMRVSNQNMGNSLPGECMLQSFDVLIDPGSWIDDRHIGGYDDLALLERRGELDELLQLAS